MKHANSLLGSHHPTPTRLCSLISGMALMLVVLFALSPGGGSTVEAGTRTKDSVTTPNPFNFNLAPTYEIGANTYDSDLADLDGDGNLDLTAINVSDPLAPTLSILYGKGDGTFYQRLVYGLSFDPSAVTSGDLNHDGRPDLVVTGGFDNKIGVFLNIGNRQFTAPAISTPPDPPSGALGEFNDVRVGDFDGDGNPDVVALQDQTDMRLRFFHVDPQGHLTVFSTLNQISGDTSYEGKIATGDFNGDGIADVALGGGGPFASRNVSFVFGRQVGALTMTYGFAVNDEVQSIKVSDLDGDGDKDIAIAFLDSTTPTEHSLQTFLNSGNGLFTIKTRISIDYPFAPADLVVNDFDRDGVNDIAALITERGNILMIARGRTDGTYYPVAYYSVPLGRSIYSADLDHDGSPDLCTVSGIYGLRNLFAVFKNDGDGKFAAPLATLWSPPLMVAGDFDKDGFKDLASSWTTTFSNTSSVDLLINDRRNGFRLPELSYNSPAALNELNVADLNGDGNLDAVTGHTYNHNGLSAYLGDGTGGLGIATFTPFSAAITRIATGDFNGDSKDDLIALDANSKAHVLLSNGNGTFTEAPNSPLQLVDSRINIIVRDYTGDHILDLVVTVNGGNGLFVGDGTGRFTLSPEHLPIINSPLAGDFDGDGNLDVFGYFNLQFIAALGDGHGHFPTVVTKTVDFDIESFACGDFDLDGYTDIAFTLDIDRDDAGNFGIVRSNGPALSWSDPVFYIVGGIEYHTAHERPYIFATDFNGDGKPDIAYFGGKSRGVIYNTKPRARSMNADFDGDGKTDAAVYRPSTGDWYLLRSTAGFGAFHFGAPSDVLTPADFTGDGKTDVAVFRPSTGTWYVLRSEDSTFYGAGFGSAGDTPTPGDFDGDGKADLAVFRPGAQAYWYLQQSTAGFAVVPFGTTGDVPAAGDYDGDGKNDVSVYRPSLGQWFRFNSSNGSFYGVQFGTPGDMIVPADYTGDGKTDNAVFRPSTSTWYILRSETPTFYGAGFGTAGDLPSPGDYDGDGKADLAVWRSGAQSVFYIQASTTGFNAIPWGIAGDRPTANAYVY